MTLRVTEEMRDALLEFTMTYLLEQPDDVVGLAHSFFSEMQESKHTLIEYDIVSATSTSSSISSSTSSISSDTIPDGRPAQRRAVVYGESYDPNADKEEFVKPVYPKTEEEREELTYVAKKTLIFRALDEEQLEDVINAMFKRVTKPGDVIITQGDDGDNFYVIEKGLFDVFIAQPGGQPEHIFTYDNSGNFGELALLYNQPRAATVIATTDGVIWALDRKTFRKLVMQSAHDKRHLYEQFIQTIPMLESLGSYEKLNIADVLVPKKFKRGDVIIRQGDNADGMFFIEQGKVSVRMKNLIGREVEIEKLETGGYFGELALIVNQTREASVYADSDTRLAFLDSEAFEQFMSPCLDVLHRNIERYRMMVKDILGSICSSSTMSSLSDSEPEERAPVRGRRAVVCGESYDPNADKEEFVKPVYPKTSQERVDLERVAKRTLLFAALDDEQLEDVINAMFKKETKPGDVIITQGEDGDNFYAIDKGVFDVYMAKHGKEPEHIFSYEDRGNFGELALLYNQPRAATVIAKTEGVIWALDRKTFRKLVMQSAHEKRQLYEEFIKTVPMLNELGSYERLNIADVLIPKRYKAGDLIIKEGDEADGMYFVEKGTVSVKIKDPTGKEVELTKVETGGYFGELALITKKNRIASVYAEDDTRLAMLDVEAFERFMGPCMNVMERNIQNYQDIISFTLGSTYNFTT